MSSLAKKLRALARSARQRKLVCIGGFLPQSARVNRPALKAAGDQVRLDVIDSAIRLETHAREIGINHFRNQNRIPFFGAHGAHKKWKHKISRDGQGYGEINDPIGSIPGSRNPHLVRVVGVDFQRLGDPTGRWIDEGMHAGPGLQDNLGRRMSRGMADEMGLAADECKRSKNKSGGFAKSRSTLR